MGQPVSTHKIQSARCRVQQAMDASSDALWEPVPPPPWASDENVLVPSKRTGFLEVLRDGEGDRCMFHAAQVCMVLTAFTTAPYNNAGLADIVSFLEHGPEGRSTCLSPEGTILGFTYNVCLPLPTWSHVFQVAIGASTCAKLYELGFGEIFLPPSNMENGKPTADTEAKTATQRDTIDDEDADCKCRANAPTAVQVVTRALGSSWVRVNAVVATHLAAVYRKAIAPTSTKEEAQ